MCYNEAVRVDFQGLARIFTPMEVYIRFMERRALAEAKCKICSMTDDYNKNPDQKPYGQGADAQGANPQYQQGGYAQQGQGYYDQNQGYNQQYQGPNQGYGQQYYQNPPPYYYGPPPRYTDPNDAPSLGYAFLGFFFPVVGLILYIVWKDQSPLKAKSAGKGALIAVILGAVFGLLAIVLSVLLGGFLLEEFYTYY